MESYEEYLTKAAPTSLRVGDWVTFERYGKNSGYGLVVGIKPYYATSDIERGKYGFHRGDYLGDLILVKRIKLGSRIKKPRSECFYAYWCEKATDEQQQEIETYFSDNPDRKRIFDETLFVLQPKPVPYLFDLTECQVQELDSFMKTFQNKVSAEAIMARLEALGIAQHTIAFDRAGCATNRVYALYLLENITEYSETHRSHLVCGFAIKPWITG